MSSLLNDYDLNEFGQEYQVVGQDEAEFDFRDFRWAKLERQEKARQPPAGLAGDATLLESQMDGQVTSIPSGSTRVADSSQDSAKPYPTPAIPVVDPLLQAMAPSDGLNQVDFSWLLSEAGSFGAQTGDPAEFWKQIGM